MKRIVIAGAGIAGLSLAISLRRRLPASDYDVVVLERSDRAGGNIRTETLDGFKCEWGPNGFLDNVPETLALVRELGLESRIQRSSDQARRRFIYHAGRLHEVPGGPGAFLTSGLLSFGGKLRIAWEPFARQRPNDDETIHAFATRRIGREAADVLIDPMVSGIFGGNARELSLEACFPKMAQMEADYGGLFKAMLGKMRERRAARARAAADAASAPQPMGAPSGTLTSFKGGMQDLIDALVSRLGPSVVTTAAVRAIERTGHGWTVTADGAGVIEACALVLAGPAGVSATLVRPFDYELGTTLTEIPSAPLAVVCLGYDEDAVARDRGPLDGFGFLVPRDEGPRILGALWDSSVYPGRAPQGRVLIRAIAGGAHDPGILALDDDALLQAVHADLRRAMGLTLDPDFVRIFRHPLGIPQYTVGHLARLDAIERRLARWPGLFLAGNAYRGPAINACVADAERLGDRIGEYLTHADGGSSGPSPLPSGEFVSAR
jgi:oxygen-dependent protoporphyrinogen oxidase